MPVRFCGLYRLSVRYDDANDVYDVRVTLRRTLAYQVTVRPPVFDLVAVDAPEAFDRAAHAAMSFFANEESGDFDDFVAEHADSGWRIRRQRVHV